MSAEAWVALGGRMTDEELFAEFAASAGRHGVTVTAGGREAASAGGCGHRCPGVEKAGQTSE
jgi:hypothetical protein